MSELEGKISSVAATCITPENIGNNLPTSKEIGLKHTVVTPKDFETILGLLAVGPHEKVRHHARRRRAFVAIDRFLKERDYIE